MAYPVGKLPGSVLAQLLARSQQQRNDPRVLVGPRIGEDGAVLDFGATCLIVSTDPISLASDTAGWYAVHVNANDVAVRGAQPRWFTAVLLLPEDRTDDALVDSIFSQVSDACASVGCTLIGGHTEITAGLERPIVVGQMMGEVAREKLVTTGGAQIGDALLLTKGIAIEGTALLAREKARLLAERGVSVEVIERAQKLLFEPGISVVRDALVANSAAILHAMHDPTEGGLATALAEMAEAAGVGIEVVQESIPILPESGIICAALGLDPLGTLASGALVVAVGQADAERVIEGLEKEGIACVQIGKVVPREQGLRHVSQGHSQDLPRFERDEVSRIL